MSGLSTVTCALNVVLDSGNHMGTAACGGGSGISGLTTGQLAIAGSASTLTSSVPFGTSGVSTVVETDGGGKLLASLIPNTAVSPGSCTNCNLTVTADGRITAQANGSGGASGISGLTTGQIPIAGSSTTVTSSVPFGVTGNSTLVETTSGGLLTNSLIAALPLANLATQAANTVVANVTSGGAVPTAASLPSCVDSAGNHLNYTNGTGFSCGTSSSGGTAQTSYTGAITGTTPTYAGAASGFVATAGFTFCSAGAFPAANAANPTLNVNSTGAKPIKLLTATGLSSLVNSEIPLSGAVCFILDASATNWVLQTATAAATSIAATDTVTAVKWASGQGYNILTASQTITLPAASTSPPGGGIFVQTGDVTAQLCATGSDVINSGQVGAGSAGGCITLPANLPQTQVVTSGAAGATAFTVPLGSVQYTDIAWAEGLDLSAHPRFGGHKATPRVLYGIKCFVQTASGASSVAHFFSTASGTAPASGTALDTGTAIDLNTASNAYQTATLAATVIVADYTLWMTASGAGTSGNGGCTFAYR